MMAFNGEILEIFSYLSATMLAKLAIVAKGCNEFLSELYFMEKQCLNSLSKPEEEGFFLQTDSCLRSKAENFQLCPFSPTTTTSIPPRSLEFLTNKGQVLASSNGLLVCRTVNNKSGNKPTKLFLCNPVTKTHLAIKLPNKELARMCQRTMDVNVVLVCGCNLGTKKRFPLDYNLILFSYDFSKDWPRGINVYMLEEGRWVVKVEDLYTGGRELEFDSYVHCKDGLYFMSDCGNYIASNVPHYLPYVFGFNFQNKTSTIVPLPSLASENFMYGKMGIFGWQLSKEGSYFESLCLVKSFDYKVSIWVLKDTKEPNSWRELLMNVRVFEDMGVEDSVSSTISFTIIAKKLVFASDNHVYSYGLEGDDQGKLELIGKHGCGYANRVRFNPYSTTLRPCQTDSKRRPCLMN